MTSKRSSSSSTPFFTALSVFGEHKRAVSAVKWCPSTLSEQLLCASVSADGTAKLWKPIDDSGEAGSIQPSLTMIGHSRGINDVAWSQTSPYLATASDDKTLRLWDCHTGDPVVEFRGHSNFCFSVRFNASGNLVVSGSFDETVKLWDVRSGDCISTIPAHSDPVTGVDFNRDGTCIVSGSHDGLIRIWDTATGECLKTIYANNNPPVSFVKYSPNGKYILSGTLDGKLRLWNASNSKCVKTYAGHSNSKYCLATSFMTSYEQQPLVVTSSEDGKLWCYDLNTTECFQKIDAHTDAVLGVDCHDRLPLIATGGMTNDRTVRFFEINSKDADGDQKKQKVQQEPDDEISERNYV